MYLFNKYFYYLFWVLGAGEVVKNKDKKPISSWSLHSSWVRQTISKYTSKNKINSACAKCHEGNNWMVLIESDRVERGCYLRWNGQESPLELRILEVFIS